MIEWTTRARRDIGRIPLPDQRRVVDAIERFVERGDGDVRKVRGVHPPKWRLRVGNWRVLFQPTAWGICILHVRPRKDAYTP